MNVPSVGIKMSRNPDHSSSATTNALSSPAHHSQGEREHRTGVCRDRKLEYMSSYNARDDVKRRAREREQTPKYKAMRKLYRDKKKALKQGLTPSQIAARLELGRDLFSNMTET